MSETTDVYGALGNATALLDTGATGFALDLREALLALLATIAEQGHTLIPAPLDPPNDCGNCGGTGERYDGTGPDGHTWSGEPCCCSHEHCSCGACGHPCELASYAVDVAKALDKLAAEREKSSREADATPGLTERQARLLDAIRTHGGAWTTRRVLHLFALTDPGTVQRGTARRDLEALTRAGHLALVDVPDNRHYVLSTRGAGRS